MYIRETMSREEENNARATLNEKVALRNQLNEGDLTLDAGIKLENNALRPNDVTPIALTEHSINAFYLIQGSGLKENRGFISSQLGTVIKDALNDPEITGLTGLKIEDNKLQEAFSQAESGSPDNLFHIVSSLLSNCNAVNKTIYLNYIDYSSMVTSAFEAMRTDSNSKEQGINLLRTLGGSECLHYLDNVDIYRNRHEIKSLLLNEYEQANTPEEDKINDENTALFKKIVEQEAERRESSLTNAYSEIRKYDL